MASRTIGCIAALVLAATGCVSESVEGDDPGQEGDVVATPRAVPNDLSSAVKLDTQGPNVAYYVAPNYDRRYWANSYTWSWAGCASDGTCASTGGTLTPDWFNAWGNYGFCGGYSWGNQCNSSYGVGFPLYITKGWGWYYRNGFGWDGYGQLPGPSGWSTFGQHPYWCVGGGTAGTWQGWSSSTHC